MWDHQFEAAPLYHAPLITTMECGRIAKLITDVEG
jgi:hypothetical protein